MAARKKKKAKLEDLDDILQDLEESLVSAFGVGSATRLSAADSLSKIDTWESTGSIVVDSVLAGGRPLPCSLMPYGRQTEISGPPGSGKTTLCAQIAAQVQASGGIVIVTDTEERIAHDYWQALGVDIDRIINLRANTLEAVFEKQYKAIEICAEKYPGTRVCMIWDSLGATTGATTLTPTKKETFMEAARKNMGRDARTISAGMRVINTAVSQNDIMYIYTNHIYHKMNVTYGPKTETYGGVKAKFMATVRLELRSIGALKEEDAFGNTRIIGNKVRVKTLKNNMAGMLMEKEAVIIGGQGFNNDYTVFEAGKKTDFIEVSGSWSTVDFDGEEVKFQGWNGFLTKVVMHPKYETLVAAVLSEL